MKQLMANRVGKYLPVGAKEFIAPSGTREGIRHSQALRHLFILFTILMLGAYLAALLQNWREAINDTRASLTHINSTLAEGVRSTMKTHELVLLGFGSELVAQGTLLHPEHGRNLIDRMQAIDPGFAGFGLARPDGQLVLVSNVAIGPALPNLAEMPESRDSFFQSIAKDRIQLGRPYFMNALKQWVSPIRVPIHNAKGAIVAVMTAGYRLEHGSTAWANMTLPPDVETALLRDDGYMQYLYPNRHWTLKQTYRMPIASETVGQIKALQSSSGFASIYFEPLREHFYMAYARLDDYGLYAGSYIPRSAVITLWLDRNIVPTVLLFIYFFGSLWAYRRSYAQQQLSENEVAKLTDWQQTLLDSAEYSIISTDATGVIVSFNAAAQRMLGFRPEELIGKHTPCIFHDYDEVALRADELSKELGRTVLPGFEAFVSKSGPGKAEEREWTYIRKNGTRFPVLLSVTTLYDRTGEITGHMGIAADLTESKQAQIRLRDSNARYRTLFESAGDSIFLMEGDRFIDCNPATLRMFGCTREQIIGEPPYRFSPEFQPDGRSSKNKALEKITGAFNGTTSTFEWQHCRYDGTPFEAEVTLNAVKVGEKPHLLATVRDVSERKEAENKLEYMALHDSLTGLFNRYALHREMGHVLGLHEEGHHALMIIDLDRFKEINDTLGHHTGDRVLKIIGQLLKEDLEHRSAYVSRLGGDEFTIFLSNKEGLNEIRSIANEVLQLIKQPFEVDSMRLEIDASIGISLYPQDGRDSHELLRSADVAMYEAKFLGKGIAFYDAATDKHSPERLAIMAELGKAVRENQLLLHYQPKFDLRKQRVNGFEALVRWQHPKLGLLLPEKFIPFAEVSDVIFPLTHFVLQRALEQQLRWKASGQHFTVAVNISARNLRDDRCADLIQGLLEQYETQPGDLELEITETALMHDPEGAADRLERIAALGVKLSIDDFGTGFSSLGYLRRLPIHTLKIDRIFVEDMLANDQDANIVRSTISLAHNLNLEVIAEGVENAEIQKLLGQMGCDLIQGYHLSRPKPWDEIMGWLTSFDQSNGVAEPTSQNVSEAGV
jgi:diguanylate cyclase (GGDEF)-like protein/PAS domain S-box-containing protein